MAKKKYKIFSLDISSASTGWSYMIDNEIQAYGKITPEKKLDKPEKLLIFRRELIMVLKMYKPKYVVIENGFFGRNVNTLKVLSNFSGVAMECCLAVTGAIPYIMNNTTTKSHFKAKNKEQLYEKIVKLYKLDDFEYDSHNDITDAVAQSRCYYETILKGTWG